MEIVILSDDTELEQSLIPFLDQIIFEKHLQNITLYSASVFSADRTAQLPLSRVYYFLFDIRGVNNAFRSGIEIRRRYPACALGLLTDDEHSYCLLCNRLFPLLGYINPLCPDWQTEARQLLDTLNQKMFPAASSLIITCCGERLVIPYREICYIETLKGSHYCNIYKTDGQTCTVRANIRELAVIMDQCFLTVRSSTIANLSLVSRIQQSKRLIFFNTGLCCKYAKIKYPLILNRMNLLHS